MKKKKERESFTAREKTILLYLSKHLFADGYITKEEQYKMMEQIERGQSQ